MNDDMKDTLITLALGTTTMRKRGDTSPQSSSDINDPELHLFDGRKNISNHQPLLLKKKTKYYLVAPLIKTRKRLALVSTSSDDDIFFLRFDLELTFPLSLLLQQQVGTILLSTYYTSNL